MAANKTLLVAGDYPLIASPTLAKAFGMAAATFLQKLHYCLQKNDVVIYQQRRYWFHSYEQWAETLGFYSISTIKRAISVLKQIGILLIEKLSAKKWLQTNFYSIDYQKLEQLFSLSIPSGKREPSISSMKESTTAPTRDYIAIKAEDQRAILKVHNDQMHLKGTSAPVTFSASTEDLNSLSTDVKLFYIALRQLKVDVHCRDNRIKDWLSRRKAVLYHITYVKQLEAGIERYQWHTPEQLGLDRFISLDHTYA